jgi:hypothetical protein
MAVELVSRQVSDQAAFHQVNTLTSIQ